MLRLPVAHKPRRQLELFGEYDDFMNDCVNAEQLPRTECNSLDGGHEEGGAFHSMDPLSRVLYRGSLSRHSGGGSAKKDNAFRPSPGQSSTAGFPFYCDDGRDAPVSLRRKDNENHS